MVYMFWITHSGLLKGTFTVKTKYILVVFGLVSVLKVDKDVLLLHLRVEKKSTIM